MEWYAMFMKQAKSARSSPDPSVAALRRVAPVRTRLFSQDVLDDIVLENLLGPQLLQPGVLRLKLLKPLRRKPGQQRTVDPPPLVQVSVPTRLSRAKVRFGSIVLKNSLFFKCVFFYAATVTF